MGAIKCFLNTALSLCLEFFARIATVLVTLTLLARP